MKISSSVPLEAARAAWEARNCTYCSSGRFASAVSASAKAFADAAEQLVNLPQEQYVKFLAAQAAKAADTGAEELIFNTRDAGTVGPAVAEAANALLEQRGVKGALTVSGETREISGGVIVRQGNIEVNCAVETLVQLRRSELASQVAEILFS